MKNITKLINYLQGIKKGGGEISVFNLSAGIRDVRPQDKEWNQKDHEMGWIQQKHNGTFSITADGKFKQYEPASKSKKHPGKKKGKKRSN